MPFWLEAAAHDREVRNVLPATDGRSIEDAERHFPGSIRRCATNGPLETVQRHSLGPNGWPLFSRAAIDFNGDHVEALNAGPPRSTTPPPRPPFASGGAKCEQSRAS